MVGDRRGGPLLLEGKKGKLEGVTDCSHHGIYVA